MMIHTHLFTLRRLLLLLLLLFDLDYSCSKSGLVVLLLVVLRMKVTKKHLTACEAFEAFSALLRSSFLRFFRILAFLTMIMAMFLPHLCHFFSLTGFYASKISQEIHGRGFDNDDVCTTPMATTTTRLVVPTTAAADSIRRLELIWEIDFLKYF